MLKKKPTTRSPLKERPLRLPGQSIQDEINCLLDEEFMTHLVFATVFLILLVTIWLINLQRTPPNPWVSTVLFGAIIAYCALRAYRAFSKAKSLKLGRDGERIVAEQLDVLKRQGAVILHDVIGDGFNLDHVILAKNGIFVAETKTWSKPNQGSPTVTYDGKVLLVNGFKPDRDPIVQAEASSRWLAKVLQEGTGKTYAVKPVVLFPGWFVEPIPRGSPVWVLEPKALPAFIQHEPVRISDADLHLAVYHLTRYIRNTQP
jgi:hypothetical protein